MQFSISESEVSNLFWLRLYHIFVLQTMRTLQRGKITGVKNLSWVSTCANQENVGQVRTFCLIWQIFHLLWICKNLFPNGFALSVRNCGKEHFQWATHWRRKNIKIFEADSTQYEIVCDANSVWIFKN